MVVLVVVLVVVVYPRVHNYSKSRRRPQESLGITVEINDILESGIP